MMSIPEMFPLQVSRDKSVKSGPLRIPWAIAEMAYAEYVRRFGNCQSLARLAERGGFGWSEMDSLYPEWREKVDVVATLEADLQRVTRERDEARDVQCAQLRSVVEQRDKLQAFKDWVHNWLDKAGVPHDPDPEHNAQHGCRIQGRMNWLRDHGRKGE